MVRNPRLNEEQLVEANQLLDEFRQRMQDVTGDDDNHYFALRRKIAKELTYDERGKPSHRKRLKYQLMRDQDGLCVHCGTELPDKGAVLDRIEAKLGYTKENVELIHPHCDQLRQAALGYTDHA